MNIGELIHAIDEAFTGTVLPEGEDVRKAVRQRDFLDESDPSLPESGLSRDALTKELLLKYYDFLFYLSPGGVLYYLPSAMKMI
ncbi:MAG TPA: hypothetical protein EYP19_01860, partial [Desulfobacterales bacterium]|nr:hypothetical protein [Desulfobacterales bacterium]